MIQLQIRRAMRAGRLHLLSLLPACVGIAFLAPARVAAQTDYYTLTVTDLTSGQPFSPPVFATHGPSTHLWQMGQPASLGLQRIAEEGDRSQAISDLTPLVGGEILDLQTPLSSPLPPLGSFSVTVGADAAHPLLSAMWMLGRTNDGFSGLDSIDLAAAAGTSIDVSGLDAGTENNNEQAAYLAALGGHLRDPENGVIHLHPGILGIADAPISWNWTNPVARIQVARGAAVPEPGTLALLIAGLAPIAMRLRKTAG